MKHIFLVAIGIFAWDTLAQGVPRCWVADQPNENIQDGVFRIFVPAENNSALTVTITFALASQAMAAEIGAGATPDLSAIEIDLFGNLQYWQPSGTFPTLKSFKDYIVASIEPVLTQPGVTVECAKVDVHVPPPIDKDHLRGRDSSVKPNS